MHAVIFFKDLFLNSENAPMSCECNSFFFVLLAVLFKISSGLNSRNANIYVAARKTDYFKFHFAIIQRKNGFKFW